MLSKSPVGIDVNPDELLKVLEKLVAEVLLANKPVGIGPVKLEAPIKAFEKSWADVL